MIRVNSKISINDQLKGVARAKKYFVSFLDFSNLMRIIIIKEIEPGAKIWLKLKTGFVALSHSFLFGPNNIKISCHNSRINNNERQKERNEGKKKETFAKKNFFFSCRFTLN